MTRWPCEPPWERRSTRRCRQARPPPPNSRHGATLKPQRWNGLWAAVFKLHAALYRLSGGALGRRAYGLPVLVLSHTGARSGKRRQTSLSYCDDGPNLAVIASKVGAPENPSWYTNLMANPNAEVQVGRQRRPVRARPADEAERARIWQRLASIYPDYDRYQRRTDRRIPVVILEPIATASYSSEESRTF